MKTVQILMSTYNGEKYLKEQIESILAQEEVNIKLLVRDDGSTDNTIQILESYENDKKLEWYTGERLFSGRSFMNLLKNCGNYEYYAFSDQDDIWKTQKIKVAIGKLQKIDKDIPAVYFCNTELVDANANYLKQKEKKYDNSFESAMIRNIATGCTMVMNKKLVELINSYKPSYILMHDAWIYRVCLAINGVCIYDEKKYVKYRQHDSNVIGANYNIIKKIKKRWKNFWKCDHSREKTAKEILNGYSDRIVNKEYLEELQQLAEYRKSYKNKVKLILSRKMKAEKYKTILFKLAIIMNKI